MKLPRIADLCHRVRIEAPQRTDDDGGGASVTWQLVDEVWAHVRSLSGGERQDAEQVTARTSVEIVCRHRADIGPTHRVVWNARIFEIKAVLDHVHDRRFLILNCEEVSQ